MTKNLILLFCLLTISQFLFSQTNKEIAKQKLEEGIKLEDEEGKFDEAIKLFEEAQKLDPENIIYPYEIAYAYNSKKEYKKAADILEKLLKHKDVYGRVYQMLGNVYDYQGKREKALDTYEKGMKKFPNAGELYLETGNIYLHEKDYNKALGWYEKGIEANPAFPSNYYWASRIFCNSSEEVWGMIYGEIFMNLERNSLRTAEISKLLFDTYKSEIKIISDTSISVSFSKNTTITLDDLKDPKNFKLPFGPGCYEMVLMLSVTDVKQIDLESLNRIRTRFVDNYFNGPYPKKYPNLLFDYQQKVKLAGHFEAYNHWILLKGDEDGFDTWKENNEAKWAAFIDWFKENPLQTDGNNKFYRAQY